MRAFFTMILICTAFPGGDLSKAYAEANHLAGILGASATGIPKGRVTADFEYPAVVRILTSFTRDKKTPKEGKPDFYIRKCTGIVLNYQCVITEKHCFDGIPGYTRQAPTVQNDYWHLPSAEEEKKFLKDDPYGMKLSSRFMTYIDQSKIVGLPDKEGYHDSYSDLAIAKLQKPLAYSYHLEHLASEPPTKAQSAEAKDETKSEWPAALVLGRGGASDKIKEGHFRYVGELREKSAKGRIVLNSDEDVTEPGDSGGPIFVENKSGKKLIQGLTQGGGNGSILGVSKRLRGKSPFVTFVTPLPPHREWISSTLEDLGCETIQ